jgi:hypothetical protein
VPNNTIAVALEVVGNRADSLHLTLSPPPIPGRSLGELTGQIQVIASPTRPSLDDPRSVEVVAGIYVGSHEDVYDSRIEWGPVDDRGISLRYTGIVDDFDGDSSKPRQPLVVEACATVIEEPHLWVTWRTTRAEEDEYPLVHRIKESLVGTLTSELAERVWFAGMPFVALELVVQVEAPGRRWPTSPPRQASDPQLIVVRVPRTVVLRGGDAALQHTLEAEIASGLEQLAKQHRQGVPRLL